MLSKILPALNATLNGTCAILLLTGYLFIRRRNVRAHVACMGAAFLVSTLFLASYLLHHWLHGSTRFPGSGAARSVYWAILVSHTALAIVIVPLVIRTLFLGIRNRLAEHTRWARWTLPLWLYVSVTGVVVYWMLYRMRWS